MFQTDIIYVNYNKRPILFRCSLVRNILLYLRWVDYFEHLIVCIGLNILMNICHLFNYLFTLNHVSFLKIYILRIYLSYHL